MYMSLALIQRKILVCESEFSSIHRVALEGCMDNKTVGCAVSLHSTDVINKYSKWSYHKLQICMRSFQNGKLNTWSHKK